MKIKKSYIIDDDEIFVVLTEIQLKKAGFFGEIRSFPNGEEAIEQINKDFEDNDLPDFVLLDLNMPIMDGWQFLEAYKALQMPTSIPVFVATSSIDPRDLERAQRVDEIRDFISKPINAEKIDQIMGKLSLLE